MMPHTDIMSRLPATRGRLRADADLGKATWFQTGGLAEVLFRPDDADDLADFLKHCPSDIPRTILGVGSNLLVRDGGIEGVVIRLGRGFATCYSQGDTLVVGAGCLNANATVIAQQYGIGGLEFLSGIPGTIGGALAMNAGAYGTETEKVLIKAEAVDPQGNKHTLSPVDLGYSYRHCGLAEGWVFTHAVLQGKAETPEKIAARMEMIARERNNTQPVRARTGGSTFKNPAGQKAWKLIDEAGCRGLRVGGAVMSELHCNFMINTGDATSEDLETLGERVRTRVYDQSGIMLEWEIKRIGIPLMKEQEMAVA
jgi:UDP-N-acetylmuramate dehydrogenase